ncbi:DUF254-domain-containing protein [Fistulina hepatica ATCC 64428]|uniref:Vacuolar fusion protein MON1 n=1 Tax=Fistulina hepatica ATCC 64428 TaxID=1128425 RepID=A0A0D7A3H0_9AGAR|nr:DUF254-domain-containing protein [Fistulina hepatica ATCC 64428]
MSVPSRPVTPGPSNASTFVSQESPSRLDILRSPESRSSLRVYAHHKSASAPYNAASSAASSVINLDLNEGIMLQDAEVDAADSDDTTAVGMMEHRASDEESRKALRAQLRKTLADSQLTVRSDPNARTNQKGKQPQTEDVDHTESATYRPREYFVFSDAGKPVYMSEGHDDVENLTSLIGVMQALVSVFLDDGDKLRCINTDDTRITFLLRPPLYFVCVSSWGAEGFLTSLISRLEFDMAMSTSSLHCLRLDLNLRKRAAEALVPSSKMKEVLYVLLVAQGRVITLIRPKKHSVHPSDIHILINTVYAPSIIRSLAISSWIPLCLPKFNSGGFVNAYISFLRGVATPATASVPPSASARSTADIHPIGSAPATTSAHPTTVAAHLAADASSTADETYVASDTLATVPSSEQAASSSQPESSQAEAQTTSANSEGDSAIALVCITTGEFDTIRTWCDGIARKLYADGTWSGIDSACRSGLTEYSAGELGIPGLRHFVYKARALVQITTPAFEEPYDDLGERRRLITLYQILHDAIHAKSGQGGTLKLQYLKTERESVIGWITQPFELYVALSPRLPKSAAVGAANALARWVKKEEARLFLRDAPVF